MSTKQRLATRYDAGNRLAAAVILADVERYGGEASLSVLVARATLAAASEAGPGATELRAPRDVPAIAPADLADDLTFELVSEDAAIGRRPMQRARAAERRVA